MFEKRGRWQWGRGSDKEGKGNRVEGRGWRERGGSLGGGGVRMVYGYGGMRVKKGFYEGRGCGGGVNKRGGW